MGAVSVLQTGISHCQPRSRWFLLGWCCSDGVGAVASCFGGVGAVASCLDGIEVADLCLDGISSCFLLGWCSDLLLLAWMVCVCTSFSQLC